METREHKQAGDMIGIETLKNPYLPRTGSLSVEEENKLVNAHKFNVQLMHEVNGVPVPMEKDMVLSGGDIVALAGDYYTEAGWGNDLQIPERNQGHNPSENNKKLLEKPIIEKETKAFNKAFSDLASPSVKKADIDRIFDIEDSWMPELLKQVVYAFTVNNYGEKLTNNVAHFDPWSLRAYTVGHEHALHSAELARACRILAGMNVEGEKTVATNIQTELNDVVQKILSNPSDFGFKAKVSEQDIYQELANRYHADAVAKELFTMHFYSDHFAAGHDSRMGLLRKVLPEKFGLWGSILVNSQHNEDNFGFAKVTNLYRPTEGLQMPIEHHSAGGDGTYELDKNRKNREYLVNGMTASMGDVTTLIETGQKPSPENFGGMTFLATIDYEHRQKQPLVMEGPDGKIYFRSDVKNIKILSPSEYQKTMNDPQNNGYEELTAWKSFWLVIQLRLLFTPKVETLTPERDKFIKGEENQIQQDKAEAKQSPEITMNNTVAQQQEKNIKPSVRTVKKVTIQTLPQHEAMPDFQQVSDTMPLMNHQEHFVTLSQETSDVTENSHETSMENTERLSATSLF